MKKQFLILLLMLVAVNSPMFGMVRSTQRAAQIAFRGAKNSAFGMNGAARSYDVGNNNPYLGYKRFKPPYEPFEKYPETSVHFVLREKAEIEKAATEKAAIEQRNQVRKYLPIGYLYTVGSITCGGWLHALIYLLGS